MKLLLDTHTLLWWLEGDRKLSQPVRRLIGNSSTEVLVSAASVWEIATKARIGKLPGALKIATGLLDAVAGQGFTPLAITLAHSQRAGWLPGAHRDPFDRMLAAQALELDVPIASTDRVFEGYGLRRIW